MRPAPSFIRRALSVGSSPAFTRRSAPFVARGVGSADSAAVGDDAEPQHAHGPPPRPRAAAHTTRCRPRSVVVAVAGAAGRLAGIIAGDVSGTAGWYTTRCRPRSVVVAVAGAAGRLAGIIAGESMSAARGLVVTFRVELSGLPRACEGQGAFHYGRHILT
jgi:hypothetical protein